MGYTLSALNQMGEEEFTTLLSNIFEETPSISRQTWPKRPFDSLETLHRALVETMRDLDNSAQLALIRSHPELGANFSMSEDSQQEQAKAGLNNLTSYESNRLQILSRAYTNKFGFPFILSIKRQTISSILSTFEQRLNHAIDQEIEQALTEIEKIAWFRLVERITLD